MKIDIHGKKIGTIVNTETAYVGLHDDAKVAPKTARPVRVLFLGSNPLSTTRLRLDEELRAVDEAIRGTRFREQLELVSQWAVRVADVQAHLMRYEPDIVHFAGHGDAGGELVLDDGRGGNAALAPESLHTLFRQAAPRARCIVINACWSLAHARALAADFPCVIGMSRPLIDAAAVAFATAFYQAIGFGRDVRAAFELAREQMRQSYASVQPRALGDGVVIPERDGVDVPILLGTANASDVTFCAER